MLLVSKSMISSASASVETSDAQIKVLDAQLKNTRLYAPADGVIAKRWLLAGRCGSAESVSFYNYHEQKSLDSCLS